MLFFSVKTMTYLQVLFQAHSSKAITLLMSSSQVSKQNNLELFNWHTWCPNLSFGSGLWHQGNY